MEQKDTDTNSSNYLEDIDSLTLLNTSFDEKEHSEKKQKYYTIYGLSIIGLMIIIATVLFSYNMGYSSGLRAISDDVGCPVTEAKNEINFFNSYAVIVIDNGTNYYHKYAGCDVIKAALNNVTGFYIFNIETARV